jgi:hypothetical protein
MNVTVLTLSDLTLTKSSLTFNLKVASQMPLLSVAILFIFVNNAVNRSAKESSIFIRIS